MDFWARFDELIASCPVVIDRPRGARHPRYPHIIYPLDYGYLEGTSGGDGGGIDVWRGSQPEASLAAVICTVDTLKKDAEVKLLIGCSDADIVCVDRFFNNHNEYMSGIVIMRNHRFD